MMLRSLKDLLKRSPKQNNVLKALRSKVVVQAVIAVQTLIIAAVLICGMSAAWYTNVVQTSGLQFEAAQWGFDGEVTVGQVDIVQAMPGDTGVVDMTIRNSGEAMSDVTVYVAKGGMVPEMQKRLFFYVETAAVRNEETLDRVYVTATGGYTYTMLPETELVLTEQQANDVRLKWQWVYDMLGYYFIGTVDAEGTATVDEYLRPVEYDLDRATFTEAGLLETVDGTTTTADFLAQLSAHDGYAEDIVSTEFPGYYQVSVDENGYGIWVYLCNWQEILAATAYDTALAQPAAEGEEKEVYQATVSLTGQATKLVYTEVTTADDLVQALGNGEDVQLQQNLVLTEPISAAGREALLDLNGYAITVSEEYTEDYVLSLTENAKLMILNGTIGNSGGSASAIHVNSSSLTLSNVTISDTYDGIMIDDAATDSVVRLVGCTMNVSRCAIQVRGNGAISNNRTMLVVEDCDLYGGYFGINGNGTNTYWGVDMLIENSTVEGYYAGIYQPQADSTTTIHNSTISGITGIALKGGDLVITDSKIFGTGTAEQVGEPAYQGSGFSDTGDALYLEDGYKAAMSVVISGSETVLNSQNGQAARVFAENSIYADVVITGGTFSSDVSAFLPEGYVYLDGTVTQEVAADE